MKTIRKRDFLKDSGKFGVDKLSDPILWRLVMASRLDRITDWTAKASGANFQVALLAEACGVTERQLRRYLRRRFGASPHEWMSAQRFGLVQSLLDRGKLVKEVAAELGFAHQSNFAREFKRRYSMTPTSLRRQ